MKVIIAVATAIAGLSCRDSRLPIPY
nr:hypothetical protein [Parabacteroides distasonis]